MKKRTTKKRSGLTRWKPIFRVTPRRRLVFWLRLPRTGLLFVSVCLFVVALNWAVQRSAWLPLPEEILRGKVAAPVRVQEIAKPAQEKPVAAPEVKKAIAGWEYFHPSWRETPDLNLVGSPKFHPDSWSISEESLRRFVRDPRRRLEADFHVTPDLLERVLFWMRIHTQYNSYMRVLHDRNDPSIIYGVADFTSLFRQSSSDGGALMRVYRYEREILRELRARLTEAAGLARTGKLSPWERHELRALISRAGALSVSDSSKLIRSIRSQTGQRDEFLMALSRSEDMLPYVEAVFRSMDLPVALARIPFVESSFNPRAYSKVGATGMWQFMPSTARQMIHPTNRELWSDPLRQTRAAARMLTIIRSILPDWSTSVTAYNSGVGRLQRLVRKHHTKSIGRILEADDPSGLGFAGKNFYAQFLSANISEAYKREIFPLRRREDEEYLLAFRKPRTFARRFRSLY